MRLSITLITVAIVAVACNNPKIPVQTHDELVQHIDSSIHPGDDFFMFSNGRWFAQNPIPASERSNGIFRTINDTINATILQICQTAAGNTNDKGSLKQKLVIIIIAVWIPSVLTKPELHHYMNIFQK
jgi:putative endopeptidase